jgi:hypothetical protein
MARSAPVQTYLIDLGRNNGTDGSATASPDANGRHWNNIQSPTQATTGNRTAVNLVNTTNGASTISVEIIGEWQSNGRLNGGLFGTNGPQAGLLADLAVETATEDYYYLSGNGATGTVRITGLDPARTYHVLFFGSRNTSTEIRSTVFSNGPRSVNHITSGPGIGSNGSYSGNDYQPGGLFGLSPNGSGQLDLSVNVASGGFGYINAMKIQRIPTLAETRVLIDFGPAGGRHSVGSADANGNWWDYVTGITGSGGNKTNLTTTANTGSGINIALNWTGDVGVNGLPGVDFLIVDGGVDPNLNEGRFAFHDVVKNAAYFNSSLTPSIQISGLDDSKTYTLILYGARGNFTRTTTYTVGATNGTIQTGTAPSGWNTGSVVRLEGLTPVSGGLTIDLSASGGFGYLSAMEMIASVRMILTNTTALLNRDAMTPLTGSSGGGALVQLIAVGANGTIDLASMSTPGDPDGDDYLVDASNNPTHVGAGQAVSDLGKFLENMVYPEALAGLPVYVRYWNATTPSTNAYYGDTPVFFLPAPGTPAQVVVDVLPAGSETPRTSVSIPTLAQWGFITLGILIAAIAGRRLVRPFSPA